MVYADMMRKHQGFLIFWGSIGECIRKMDIFGVRATLARLAVGGARGVTGAQLLWTTYTGLRAQLGGSFV